MYLIWQIFFFTGMVPESELQREHQHEFPGAVCFCQPFEYSSQSKYECCYPFPGHARYFR